LVNEKQLIQKVHSGGIRALLVRFKYEKSMNFTLFVPVQV